MADFKHSRKEIVKKLEVEKFWVEKEICSLLNDKELPQTEIAKVVLGERISALKTKKDTLSNIQGLILN